MSHSFINRFLWNEYEKRNRYKNIVAKDFRLSLMTIGRDRFPEISNERKVESCRRVYTLFFTRETRGNSLLLALGLELCALRTILERFIRVVRSVPLAFRIVRDNGIPFRSTDFSIDFAMLDIVHHSYRVIRLKELKISRMF